MSTPTPHERRVQRYAEWLMSQGVKYSFDKEIARLARNVAGEVRNDTPPVDLWHAILPTVRVVEQVREAFGPTTINSAYRSPAYNTAIGGRPKSEHLDNTALDFRCQQGTPREWMTFLRKLREEGVFKGGVGVYPRSGFVHVDTRGVNADWGE